MHLQALVQLKSCLSILPKKKTTHVSERNWSSIRCSDGHAFHTLGFSSLNVFTVDYHFSMGNHGRNIPIHTYRCKAIWLILVHNQFRLQNRCFSLGVHLQLCLMVLVHWLLLQVHTFKYVHQLVVCSRWSEWFGRTSQLTIESSVPRIPQRRYHCYRQFNHRTRNMCTHCHWLGHLGCQILQRGQNALVILVAVLHGQHPGLVVWKDMRTILEVRVHPCVIHRRGLLL